MRRVKEGKKQRYLLHTHTHVCMCSKQNKEETLMTITVLVSLTGHMVAAGIYNCFLPLPVLYSLCL